MERMCFQLQSSSYNENILDHPQHNLFIRKTYNGYFFLSVMLINLKYSLFRSIDLYPDEDVQEKNNSAIKLD